MSKALSRACNFFLILRQDWGPAEDHKYILLRSDGDVIMLHCGHNFFAPWKKQKPGRITIQSESGIKRESKCFILYATFEK